MTARKRGDKSSQQQPHWTQWLRLLWKWLPMLGLGVVLCHVLVGSTCVFSGTNVSPAAQTLGSGKGAGGFGMAAKQVHAPTATCNIFDEHFTSCVVSGLATFVATQIDQALQPVVDAVIQSPADPANIVFQTPLTDTNTTLYKALQTVNNALIGVFDASLAVLLVIGGYNIMFGLHLRLMGASPGELIPRAVVVTVAVHFNQLFLGYFIDFENQLCLTVIHATSIAVLTNVLSGLTTNPFATLLMWVLDIVLLVMIVLLLFQQAVRLGLVALGWVTAPLGLGCLLLGQTVRWGRMWMSFFSMSVMVQFLQVTALGLGGILISSLNTIAFFRLDLQLQTIIIAIAVLYLVLRIPNILQNWMLQPMFQGGNRGSGNAAQGNDGEEAVASGNAVGSGSAAGGTVDGTIVTEEAGSFLLLF